MVEKKQIEETTEFVFTEVKKQFQGLCALILENIVHDFKRIFHLINITK